MCVSVLLPLSLCGLVSFKLSNTKCRRAADSAVHRGSKAIFSDNPNLPKFRNGEQPWGMLYQAPSEARGVVIGGPEYVKSCSNSLIDSEMAGPISMKLSGIDRGNSVDVLSQKN